MTTTLKALYGTLGSDISASGLNSLANGSVAYSSAVDNSANLYGDFLIEVYIDGTAATNGYLEIRLCPSVDGTNYSDNWYSCIPLGVMDFAADLGRGIYSVVGHGGYLVPPPYFKIGVRNATGAALAATGSTIKAMPINIQQV